MSDNENKSLNGENESSVHDEMEELARIFREELGKAREEAEKETSSEDFEELEVEGYAVTMGDKKETAVDELCECCGERPRGTKRNPNSPFCDECAAIMEKYPYDWKGIIMLIAVLGVMVLSLVTFVEITPIFAQGVRGNNALRKNELYSASAYYNDVSEYIGENNMTLKFKSIIKNKIITEYKLLYMSDVLNDIETNYDVKNIKDKDIKKIYDSIRSMNASATMIQEHLGGYSDSDVIKKYDDLISTVEGLIGKKIYVTDTEIHDESEEDFKPTGKETVFIYDEGWIRLYQYSIAVTADNEKDTKLYLEKAVECSEYLESLAAPLLAQTYIGSGEYDKAEPLINRVKERNSESAEYYMLLSMMSRYKDKNYTAAKDICITGLENLSYVYNSYDLIAERGAMLSMQKTLALIMAKDYEGAYASAKECYSYQTESGSATIQARDLYAVLALATGDEDTFKELSDEIKQYEEIYGDEMAFTDDVKDYQAGKITLQEIAMSGRYDLV